MQAYFRKNFPVILIVILCAVPVARWFFLGPLTLRFFDLNSTMTSFGQITGLLGMILFSLNLIISNRSRFFDHFFSGIHHFYDTHKWLGSLAFSLLLFHPLFLAVKYLGLSVYDAAMFLLPGGINTNTAITLGSVALLGMILLLSLTLYFKIRYHIWRFSHKFMVAVFIVAIMHVLLISSDVSRDLFLRYYILLFAFWGLAFGSYRAFFRFFFNKDYSFRVKEVILLNGNVVEIELAPEKGAIKFEPGQFIFVRFVAPATSSEPHPFSIASAESSDHLKIVVKALGDFTGDLDKIKPGMLAKIEGPFGKFYAPAGRKEIWIAGGVGITPFLSMARSLREITRPIDLYYCLNEPGEAVFLDELRAISATNPKFRVITWFSKEKGRINVEKIKEISEGVVFSDIYICGPLLFMRSLRDQFTKQGVESKNIYFEEFNLL